MTFLLDIAFRSEGWRYVLGTLRGRRRVTEAALLVLSAALWASPFLVLGWRWLAIYVGAQWVGNLYLNLVFATNHKGMPTWAAGRPLTFLERQVLSSCNVAGPGRRLRVQRPELPDRASPVPDDAACQLRPSTRDPTPLLRGARHPIRGAWAGGRVSSGVRDARPLWASDAGRAGCLSDVARTARVEKR